MENDRVAGYDEVSISRNFFVIDSDNVQSAATKLYGYAITGDAVYSSNDENIPPPGALMSTQAVHGFM